MAETTNVDRRTIVNWFFGTSFGALILSAVYPIVRFVSPPDIPEAATNEVEAGLTNDPELLEKGFKIVRFGAEPVLLVRLAETDFRAFSATCTHLDCVVGYKKEKNCIWCNCHNGEYDMNGRNVAGPPPKQLAPFKVQIASKNGGPGTLVISKG
jgi:cytochrome b6-f complex iron-sulfur subunit